jgi:hypothetical protein
VKGNLPNKEEVPANCILVFQSRFEGAVVPWVLGDGQTIMSFLLEGDG